MQYKSIWIKNGRLEMEVGNVGAAIMRLLVPDANGKLGDVVLGYEKPEDYLESKYYFGAAVGRVCNRIGGAKIPIDGRTYKLDCNETARKNTLHGGANSFEKMIWDLTECGGANWKGVQAHALIPDMYNGFPGNLDVSITYKLTDAGELEINYCATTDRPTVCALTNHSYFDLSCGEADNILDHRIKIFADYFTPVSSNMVTTGEVLSVRNTALDLRRLRRIGDGISMGGYHIETVGGGYDHNFVLQGADGDFIQAAAVYDELTGRAMEVFTTEPGVQFYSGTFIDAHKGKYSRSYGPFSGFALETQHWPDAQNKRHFPSIDLYPDETYSSTTVYRFGTFRA